MFKEVGSVLKRKDYTATTGLRLWEDNFHDFEKNCFEKKQGGLKS